MTRGERGEKGEGKRGSGYFSALKKKARFGLHPYDLVYAYDIAGNRTQKVDVLNDVEVYYFYDVAEPETYGSQGNRLMKSIAAKISSGDPVESRWYTYDVLGNVDLVVRELSGDEDGQGNQWYRGTQLYYVRNGMLWLSRSIRWQGGQQRKGVRLLYRGRPFGRSVD